jgi:AraC-like DNA-binding protein/ketosteroid isomerase-like protein
MGAPSHPRHQTRYSAPMGADTLTVVNTHNARWAAGDLEGLYALYHPDMVFTDHYTGQTYTGQTLRNHVAGVIGRSALGTLTYTDRVCVDGDTATLRYREVIRSAHGDDLMAVRACDVVKVRAGCIVSIDEYAIPESLVAPVLSPPRPRHRARVATAGAHQSLAKIGLTARALGHLLADLDAWMRAEKPFCQPMLTLQQVAAATGYTRNQISFALNQGRGVGFFEYLNRVRVEHLLQQVPVPAEGGVVAWSELAGFRSVSTFYKAFRAVTGESPAGWLLRHPPLPRPTPGTSTSQ